MISFCRFTIICSNLLCFLFRLAYDRVMFSIAVNHTIRVPSNFLFYFTFFYAPKGKARTEQS